MSTFDDQNMQYNITENEPIPRATTEHIGTSDANNGNPIHARRERSSSSDVLTTPDIKTKPSLDEKPDFLGPYAYMGPKLRSLVLWKRPAISAGVLGGSLAFLSVLRWISLINVTLSLLVFGILASFVYVNGVILFNRITNKPNAPRPLAEYYSRSSNYLSVNSEFVHSKIDYLTDGLNVVISELAKVVLIQDNTRSLKFVGIFYVLWTLKTYFSTTTLLSIVVISLFGVPRLYLSNQAVIDAQFAKVNDLAQTQYKNGRQVVQGKWEDISAQATTFAREKGLLKKKKE